MLLFLDAAALWAVLLCWLFLGATFVFVRRAKTPGQKTAHSLAWKTGLVLQAASISVAWTFRRPPLTPIARVPAPFSFVLPIVTAALAIASVWLMFAAKRVLGEHWSYKARLVEGHELVTRGPYRFVRHPIYTGLFGLTLASVLAFSTWIALLPCALIYAAGTAFRIRAEEALLRGAFGAEFDAYANRVPAVIPGLW